MNRELVVDLVGIAPRHQLERPFGQAGLEAHYGLRVGSSLLRPLAQQLQHLLDMLHILVPQLDGFRVVFEIIIAVRQTQTALIGLRNHQH